MNEVRTPTNPLLMHIAHRREPAINGLSAHLMDAYTEYVTDPANRVNLFDCLMSLTQFHASAVRDLARRVDGELDEIAVDALRMALEATR